jgi:hypothetical protein
MAKRKHNRAPVSREKAKKILRDGEIRGKPLTARQKRFFGLIAGGKIPTRTVGV